MGREAEMADVGPLDEAGLDHEPAQPTLRSAETEERNEFPAIALRNGTLPREPEKREGEDQTDQAADQPVNPFPEEDEFELGEIHSGRAIDFPILRGGLVEVEGVLPLVMRQW